MLTHLDYIEGPCNNLNDNISHLHFLVTLAQLKEGKSLIDPAVSSNDKDELYFCNESIPVSVMMRLGDL